MILSEDRERTTKGTKSTKQSWFYWVFLQSIPGLESGPFPSAEKMPGFRPKNRLFVAHVLTGCRPRSDRSWAMMRPVMGDVETQRGR